MVKSTAFHTINMSAQRWAIFGGFSCSTLVILGSLFLRLFCFTEGRTPFQMRKVIVVDYFENCDQKFYPIMCVNFTFKRNGTTTIINGDQIAYRGTGDKISVKYTIDKCKDKSNPDTCEYYTTWKWDNICATMNVMPFMARFFNALTPPATCPLKKDQYHLKDAKLESSVIAQFLGSGQSSRVLWKFRVLTRESNQTIACVDFGFRIADVRIKQPAK